MTTRLFAPAAYARYQTSGASYTADAKGVIPAAATGDVIDLIRSGCIMLPAYDNLSATTDPGASDDSTQDYSVGSRWLNISASRAWTCLAAATGAAIWVLDGVVPGVGVVPSNMLTYFGSGTGTILGDGNLNRQIGNPLAGNNADTTDDVLASYTLPASSFDVAGRGLCIAAQGTTGATTNDKRVKLWCNATISVGVVTGGNVIADTGPWVNGTIPNSNVGWQLTANVLKYGAPDSNTQYAQGTVILGGIHGGIGLPVFPTAVEAEAIVIALTGSSYTTGAPNDVVATWFEVSAMN
ncbi:MAG: hypothetical protein JO282_14425 [Alphaproteobacteria bacterium]|nr:hypothetical protein [Alphaproteobacteria bacterium]